MSDEDKIQHTDALALCNKLTHLNNQINKLQHELVLHYSATGVPPQKTKNQIRAVEMQMENVQEQLDVIETELDGLDR